MKTLARMGAAAAAVLLLGGCDALLGVDFCNKACESAEECGTGFTCDNGLCNAPECEFAGDAGHTGGGDAGHVSSSSSSSGQSSSSSSSSSTSSSGSSSSSSGASSTSGASSAPASSTSSSSGASSTGGVSSSTSTSSSSGATSGVGSSAGGSSSGVVSSSTGTSGTASSSTASSGGGSSAGVSSSALPSSSSLPASSSAQPSSSSGLPPGPCVDQGNPLPAGSPCLGNRICDGSGACISACYIADTLEPAGVNPDNACESCEPGTSTTAWTPLPNTPCPDADDCDTDLCDNNGVCQHTPVCSGALPVCSATPTVTCGCTLIGGDSCATQTTNMVCLAEGGACGCSVDLDCEAGSFCGAGNTCQTCATVDHCGSSCEPCSNLTPDESRYYSACSGNTDPIATACASTACTVTTANCDNDSSNQCEVNITNDGAHCGGCDMVCGTGVCDASRCTCTTDTDCPMGSTLQQTCLTGGNPRQCGCTSATSEDCAAGYTCTLANGPNKNKCVRQ